MSIQNNTAVDVYQDFILPTALDSDFSSEDLADDMDGLQMTMQRVKIPGGGNLQFEIRSDDPDNPDYERKLVGVILYHHLANAYPRPRRYHRGGRHPHRKDLSQCTADHSHFRGI